MRNLNNGSLAFKARIPEPIDTRTKGFEDVDIYEPEVMVRLSTNGNRWCLGEAIRVYRLLSHLSQSEIAAAVNRSKSYVSSVEAGNQRVSHAFIIGCAEAMGIEADDIYRLAISHLEASDKDRTRSPKAAARHMLARFASFVAKQSENCIPDDVDESAFKCVDAVECNIGDDKTTENDPNNSFLKSHPNLLIND